MTICQTKKTQTCTLLSIFLMISSFGCTSTPVVQDNAIKKINPKWGEIPQRFSTKDEKGVPATHLFFDVDPKLQNLTGDHKTNLPINYIVTTPEKSDYNYSVDLYSGKLYRDKLFCARNDIWDNYKGDLTTPNFTQGFVPRVFDKMKNPLKVIVINGPRMKQQFQKDPKFYEEARVLGSFIVEECESYPCDFKDKWKATQVLVGVDQLDQDMKEIVTFKELKNQTNWKYTRAFVENLDGVHKMGSKYYPRTRITAELNLADTYKFLQENSIVFDQKKYGELVEWRKSCMNLYDDLWQKVEKIKSQKEGQEEEFLKVFRAFYQEKNEDFHACSKIVRPSNILDNKERHWFFTYIQAFDILVKNGYYFSCVNSAWIYNPKNADGSFYVNQIKELQRCKAKNLDVAFEYAVNGFHLMKNSTNQTFRYVEYDNKKGGSHQFLYSWIYDKSKNLNCKYKKENKNQINYDVFPQDVVWEVFKEDTGKKTIR